MRKKIGIASTGWNDEYQQKIMAGIIEVCKECDYDTVSFTSNNIDYQAEEQNRCAYNIYNLLSEDYLDGLILIVNTIYYEEIIEKIIQRASEMTIPVVCVNLERDGMFCVGTDNYNSTKLMVEHLLEDEQRTRFACLTGVDSNPENQSRVQAFKDAVTKRRGDYSEHYIYQGNFQYQCGIEAANFWHNAKEEYPDAIFCANDTSARGFMERTLELGYRIPEDVKVVAYDNTFLGQYAIVPLSSIECPLEQIGSRAVRIIQAVLNGEKVIEKELISGTPFFRESSGNKSDISAMDYKNKYGELTQKVSQDSETLFLANLMTEQVSNCNTIDELVVQLKGFVDKLNCSGFYVCFTLEQLASFVGDFVLEDGEPMGYMLEGYSSYMYMPMLYEDGKLLESKIFNTQKILPSLWEEKEERMDYTFFPLYFRGKTQGYCVISNCKSKVYEVSFQTWLAFFSYMVNNLYLHQELAKKAKELEFLHEKDAMTGAYNRFGFGQHAPKMMEECVKKGSSMMVMFADMDDLKYINDRFGHEEGDRAICAFTNILLGQCKKGEIVARFGGDEMVVYAIDYTEQDAVAFANEFQRGLDNYNEQNHLYELRVSVGFEIFKPDKETNLDKCISSADANMYQEKYRRKKYLTDRRMIRP